MSNWKIGDCVFAKIRGFPPWPARIEECPPEGIRIKVYFFGTYETAWCSARDICPFNPQTKEKYVTEKTVDRKGFLKGMEEIERAHMEQSFDTSPFSSKWVAKIKLTGDIIEVDPRHRNPEAKKRFTSEKTKQQRYEQAVKNGPKMKELLENADIISKELKDQIMAKNNNARTPQERTLLLKEREMRIRTEKVRWLQVEQRLVDLDARLKKNIDISGPNLDKCVLALEELESLPIAKLMLKKQPDIVCTVEKLRKYVGPPGCGEDQKALTRTIRVKADKFSRKVKTAFGIPMESGLWSEFEPLAIEFRHAVSGMDKTQVLAMVSDPVTTVS